MKTKDEQIQVALRVPKSFLTRIDKLALRTSRPGQHVTRTEMMRITMYRGAEEIEAEKPQK